MTALVARSGKDFSKVNILQIKMSKEIYHDLMSSFNAYNPEDRK